MGQEIPFLYQQSPLRIDYSGRNLVRMNLNENLVLPRTFLRSALARCTDGLDPSYYPSSSEEGEILELRNEIARYCRCSTDSVAIGNGSDQAIDLLLRSQLRKRTDALVTIEPTFSMYRILAARLGSKSIVISTRASTDEEPFSLNFEKVESACKRSEAKLLVLASPNNPTGVQYPIEEIRGLIESQSNKTVMIDEAYVEYGDYTIVRQLAEYPNLVISRTFSKAFGLASFRLGYLVSSNIPLIKEIGGNLQYPYPISGLTAMVAIHVLRRKEIVLGCAEKTKEYREEMVESLRKFENHLRVLPNSRANFVLVHSSKAKKIAQDLLSRYGIAVKYLPRLGRERNFLRITVGTRELNERLLYALRRMLV